MPTFVGNPFFHWENVKAICRQLIAHCEDIKAAHFISTPSAVYLATSCDDSYASYTVLCSLVEWKRIIFTRETIHSSHLQKFQPYKSIKMSIHLQKIPTIPMSLTYSSSHGSFTMLKCTSLSWNYQCSFLKIWAKSSGLRIDHSRLTPIVPPLHKL